MKKFPLIRNCSNCFHCFEGKSIMEKKEWFCTLKPNWVCVGDEYYGNSPEKHVCSYWKGIDET